MFSYMYVPVNTPVSPNKTQGSRGSIFMAILAWCKVSVDIKTEKLWIEVKVSVDIKTEKIMNRSQR